MMKQLFRLVCLLCLGIFALAACAPATTPTAQVVVETRVVKETQIVEVSVEAPVAAPSERVEVRLAGWEAGARETDLIESLLYKFTVENPGILVRYEPIPSDYWSAINSLVVTGDMPDIFYMESFQFPGFVESGLLLPLDDLMAADGADRADFIPSVINAFSRDGATYGIPKEFDSLGLYYNKDLFTSAGRRPPTDDWTWEDLRAAAEALSSPARVIYGLGVTSDATHFPIFAFQGGGSIMTDDFGDTRLDAPETVEAAVFYTGFRKDRIGALPSDVGEDSQAAAFGKGEFAMVYDDSGLIPDLRDQFPDTNYGVVVPPAGPAGEGNLVFPVAYVVSQASEHPEEAWRVIEFLTREASQAEALESGLALPTRAALGEHDYFASHPAAAAIFRGAFEGARPYMWGQAGLDVNEQLEQALERVYVFRQRPETSMEKAAEAIRAVLQSH